MLTPHGRRQLDNAATGTARQHQPFILSHVWRRGGKVRDGAGWFDWERVPNGANYPNGDQGVDAEREHPTSPSSSTRTAFMHGVHPSFAWARGFRANATRPIAGNALKRKGNFNTLLTGCNQILLGSLAAKDP